MKAMFIGEQRDIGRFGTLRRGDVVVLSDREWDSVREDAQNWLEADSEEAKKIKVAKLELNADEKARITFEAKQLPADAVRELALMPPGEAGKKRAELIAAREKEFSDKALKELKDRHDDALRRENDEGRVVGENLHSMTREALLRQAKALQEQGKGISITDDMPKKALIVAIKGALNIALTGEDEGE
jgi:hypothetical protein